MSFDDVVSQYDINYHKNYENSYYSFLKKYEVKIPENVNFDTKSDDIQSVVFYSIRESLIELKSFYLSFISQLINTDIKNVTLIVLRVSPRIKKLAKDILGVFENNIENFYIESYPENGPNKNSFYLNRINNYTPSRKLTYRKNLNFASVSNHCFLSGNENNLYENISRFLKKNKNEKPVLACKGTWKYPNFLKRFKSEEIFYDIEEFTNFYTKRLGVRTHVFKNNVVSNKRGVDNSFFAFPPNVYPIEDKKWVNFSEWCRVFCIRNEDLVFVPYAFKKNYSIFDISNVDVEFIKSQTEYQKDKSQIINLKNGKFKKEFIKNFLDTNWLNFKNNFN